VARFTFEITQEQIDQIVQKEILHWWSMIGDEIETSLAKKESLLPHHIEDLEYSLDMRTHLKNVLKYCMTKDDRKRNRLPF
jgi:hypothetical protein